MFKKTIFAITLSIFTLPVMAKLPIVSDDSKSCQQVISPKVSDGLFEKIMRALPKDDKDNVYEAIKLSNAVKMNKQKITNIFTDVIVSIYSTPQQVWARILDKAIEVAKDTVDKLITTLYNDAISRVMSIANNATSRVLNKITDRLNRKVGNVVNAALGEVVPEITNTLGQCAQNLNADCLLNAHKTIGGSIQNGIDRGIGSVQNGISSEIDSRISGAYYGKINEIGGLHNETANVVHGMTSEIFYTTKSIAREAVYSFDKKTATEALLSIGGDPLIQLYGQGE